MKLVVATLVSVILVASCGDGEGSRIIDGLDRCTIPSAEELVSLDELEELLTLVAQSSPNRSGDPKHAEYVDELEQRFTALGADVQSIPHALTDQVINEAKLIVTVGETTLDASVSSIPRAGLGRVEGPLVWVPNSWSDAPSVVDAVVVRPLPTLALSVDALLGEAWEVYDPNGSLAEQPEYRAGESFERPWLSSRVEPDLIEAESRGALGVVYTRPLAVDDVKDMWSQTALLDIPAVQIGQPQSTALTEALDGGTAARATLEVAGQRGPFDARSLRIDIPGPDPESPVVVVQTHTDSMNALQENGGPALFVLLRAWLERPPQCNRLALRLELSAAHRNGLAGALSADRAAMELGTRLAAVISVEHLGAREYTISNDAGGVQTLRTTGRLEPTAFTFPSELVSAAERMRESVIERKLDRVLFLEGGGSAGYFGEAKVFAQRGRLTFELISGPWVQNSPQFGLEAIDLVDMRRKIGSLLDLLIALEP
ncbi:MAG: hypothetical protein AAF654_14635 [Myxococcota bacterium]